MESGVARNYLIKIDLTLADNTVLNLTNQDIWSDSFAIETASSGTSSFDIGSAVIGKCKFTINNIDGDFDGYDFFNASAVVWVGLDGDVSGSTQQYYRMGFFTVDEPEKANGLISLTLLDYMWKFDVPFSEVTINYPATARTIVQTMCTYCGVSLSGDSQTFNGYNFTISEEPKDKDNMNCREMLQYLAMIGGNFCLIDDTGHLVIKWYNTSATASDTATFEHNMSTSFGTEDIEITGVKFVIDKTEYKIGTNGYVLELTNPLVTASNVNTVLNLIWTHLDGFTLRTFNCTTASDLSAEIGDKCKIKDYKGNYVYSWITLNSFKFAGHQLQCNAVAPNRTLVKRYSQAVQAAVEVARQEANQVISNYDLAVQMMNDLAVNAMGGYEEYEEIGTGGRVWYLSNMPITKNPTTGVCSFEPNSTVFKRSGSGFFVSRDGGTTWVNGYDIQTGELVVNVLDAIGINFDWARGGTLTLGGYGNGNGILSILNSANVEKVHGDNTGLKVGGTLGSKIFITTEGTMEYYYDNAYAGRIYMDAINHGTQEDPDLRDTFLIQDFNDIGIRSDDEMAEIYLSTYEVEGGQTSGYVKLFAHKEVSPGEFQYSEIRLDGDGIHLDSAVYAPSGDRGITNFGIRFVGTDYNTHEIMFADGICVGYDKSYTPQESSHVEWHTWDSPDPSTYYDSIILAVNNTSAIFPDLDSDDSIAYEPFIKCASGVAPPKITDMVRTGNSITVTFTAVTSAQVGNPTPPATSECVIKLLRIKG